MDLQQPDKKGVAEPGAMADLLVEGKNIASGASDSYKSVSKSSRSHHTRSKCTRSSSSSYKKELLELENLQKVLDLKENILKRKLEIIRKIDQESDSELSDGTSESQSRTRSSRTLDWVASTTNAAAQKPVAAPEMVFEPVKKPPFITPSSSDLLNKHQHVRDDVREQNAANATKVMSQTSAVNSTSNDVFVFEKLANALNNSIKSAIFTGKSNLPSFDGSQKDWLQFKASYDDTTKRYNIAPEENLQRLRLSLKGEARNLVAALLHSCSSPDSVIEALQLRYGNPTKIIKAQIAEIKASRIVGNATDPSELSVFAAKLVNCVAAIQALQCNDYLRDTDLYDTCISKLNAQLRSKFLHYADEHSFEDRCALLCLKDFIQREARLAQKFIPESSSYSRQAAPASASGGGHSGGGHSSGGHSGGGHIMSHKRYSVNAVTNGNVTCSFCNDSGHNVTKCPKFLELPVNDRYAWAKDNKKCFRCLIYSHAGKNCRISKFLHMLLKVPKVNDKTVQKDDNSFNDNVNNLSTPISTPKTLGSLLKVVPITVRGPSGVAVKTFALLDEGATISLIDTALAHKVGARGQENILNIHGVCSLQSFNSQSVKVTVETCTNSTYDLNVRTMPNLNLQSQFMNKEKLISYSHIKAHQHLIHWYESGTPQMIIGQDYWYLIVTRNLYSGKLIEPVVSETLLGFVVHGRIEGVRNSVLSHCVAHLQVQHTSGMDDDLHSLIKENFSLDSLGIEPKSRSDPSLDRSLKSLKENTKKIDGNQWETCLLWAEDNNILPNSHERALKRLYSLEKTFKKNPELAKGYSAQMNRLFEQKFAELYQGTQEKDGWILSHFAALNPNKPNKVRIVFDCADKIQGESLNDHLLTGPDLLQPLLGVLWRFRRAPIAVAGDIKDMFLKIKIKKEDQEFQKFYWRDLGDSSPPKLYVMTSMLFGAKCSPSSAIFVKNRNAQDFLDSYAEAVKAIENNHYCDDYLDSYYSEQKAIEMTSTISKIHSHGNFDICNWASNSEIVLQSIPVEKRACGDIQLASGTSSKERTLGMMWQPSTDTLSFNLSMNRVPIEVSSGRVTPTKRQMLAVVMSVFDPIGLLSLFTIRGRILLQDVWRSGIGWDDHLKDIEYEKWKNWLSDFQLIRECSVPRCYVTRSDDASIQLHTYCDASNKAYAAVCYLRYQYGDEVQVVLVAGKARVTPLKPCSVPRLELQGAVLATRLAHTVATEHQLPIQEKFYWTDSMTTLAWIRSDPRNYKPFVGHRLAAIDDLSASSQWRWVPTSFNPADLATRDSTKRDVSLDGPWFSGPSYLKKKREEWPVEKTKIVPVKEATCEEKHAVNVIKKKEDYLPDVSRFSSWKRLVNTTAYMLLFIELISKKTENKNLTLKLLEKAEKLWIAKSQEDDFPREMAALREKENISSDSKIFQLSPVLDGEGIMRLGGRIDRTPGVNQEIKRPVILSGNNTYTKLLIHHYHKQYNHASTETVVNELRQKYWVIKLRSTVRFVAHNCQYCRIRRAAAVQPPMGDLPLPRLQHHKRPFTFCGLDYFGPMEVSIGRRREKRWGALFTCLVTRAVHMEIAGSLSADSVIMAIRRMSARRGCPTAIYSDNGTNFKGANNELQKAWSELNKEAIATAMSGKKIEWHYIPATAAHMGGSWERLVQSIKKALKTTLQERAPKEETLSTLITEAEQSVNSRPLTFVSVDPRDPEALTPNHFLIGSSSAAPIPGSFDDKDLMLRKQWKVAQRLADMFWSRWLREYLPTLLDRKMKGTVEQDIKEGQLVILVDQNSPRNVWPRGVISKTFPGQDGTVRVVEVRTAGGLFRRPVNKVVILPVVTEDSSSDVDASANCLSLFLSRLQEVEGRARDGVLTNSAFVLPTKKIPT